jgi:hypothetical protein
VRQVPALAQWRGQQDERCGDERAEIDHKTGI